MNEFLYTPQRAVPVASDERHGRTRTPAGKRLLLKDSDSVSDMMMPDMVSDRRVRRRARRGRGCDVVVS